MTGLFYELLLRPISNALVALYVFVPGGDFGIAIILLTGIIRLAFWPLQHKALHSQRAMQALQPQMEEVRKKYKGDQKKQSEAMMALYKEHKVNPASGCLPLLVQLPFLIAIFRVLNPTNGFGVEILASLYPFLPSPESINPVFLGLVDLSERSVVLAVLAGALQFVQSRMISSSAPAGGSGFGAMMNKQMLYFFPILTVFFALSFPAGLALYWVTTTVFAIAQQLVHDRQRRANEQLQRAT